MKYKVPKEDTIYIDEKGFLYIYDFCGGVHESSLLRWHLLVVDSCCCCDRSSNITMSNSDFNKLVKIGYL